ncbi:MAG TPA: FeoA family protein [Clostridia bacterium]|nr:FeoA family protein [Clostridia bacterium]
MIFNFISDMTGTDPSHSLYELPEGTRAVVHEFRLAQHVVEHLMNLGFVPGVEIEVSRSGPGGDPRVYRVDGTEVALRRDVSQQIEVRPLFDGARP